MDEVPEFDPDEWLEDEWLDKRQFQPTGVYQAGSCWVHIPPPDQLTQGDLPTCPFLDKRNMVSNPSDRQYREPITITPGWQYEGRLPENMR